MTEKFDFAFCPKRSLVQGTWNIHFTALSGERLTTVLTLNFIIVIKRRKCLAFSYITNNIGKLDNKHGFNLKKIVTLNM